MKKTLYSVLLAVLVLMISGCGKGPAADKVEEDCAVFSSGDIAEINQLIFHESAQEPDTSPRERGFLAELMAMSKVTVVSSEEDHAVVKVTAPDMSDFFRDCAQAVESMTSTEEMTAQVLAYAADAPKVSRKVSLAITYDGEDMMVHYADPVFIDAITGGLLQAYCDVLDEMIGQLGGGA